jgi:hypothetical protein
MAACAASHIQTGKFVQAQVACFAEHLRHIGTQKEKMTTTAI